MLCPQCLNAYDIGIYGVQVVYNVGFGIILGFVLDGVIHSLIRSLPLAANI